MEQPKQTYIGQVYGDAAHDTEFFAYETIEVKKFKCTHPRVKMAFETGGLIINDGKAGEMTYNVCLILEDDTRHDFSSETHTIALKEADNFLKTI